MHETFNSLASHLLNSCTCVRNNDTIIKKQYFLGYVEVLAEVREMDFLWMESSSAPLGPSALHP